MILELATVLALQGPQCPYLPLVDPPHGKLFCHVWLRLGNPPDRPYLKGINPLDFGGFPDDSIERTPDNGDRGCNG